MGAWVVPNTETKRVRNRDKKARDSFRERDRDFLLGCSGLLSSKFLLRFSLKKKLHVRIFDDRKREYCVLKTCQKFQILLKMSGVVSFFRFFSSRVSLGGGRGFLGT